MISDVVASMLLANSIGVTLVLLGVWGSVAELGYHPTEAKRLEVEKHKCAAARVTLTTPLWMWVVWPILAVLLLYVVVDKIHDLWLMAKSPPKQMPEPPPGKGPYR